MAKEYHVSIPAHPSIYQPGYREIDLFFCEPDQGINSDTGLLLLIPGFGANAQSKVYKKMRLVFADKYNLVTVQCNYFGYEFMQDSRSAKFNIDRESLGRIFTEEELKEIYDRNSLNIKKLMEIGSKYNINFVGYEELAETDAYLNDMGVMQALDNLTALLVTAAIIQDNNYSLNTGKIIFYGHSHGAYLGYLCNALAPSLFSLLIDNSAWLLPAYLNGNRAVIKKLGNCMVTVIFEYIAGKLSYDQDLLYLPSLYKKFNNKCNIVSFHGSSDILVSNKEKKAFCKSINSCSYQEVQPDMVDGEIFKSTGHGLDADFLKLFDYVMDNNSLAFNKMPDIYLPVVNIETAEYAYTLDYGKGVPMLVRESK